MQTDRIDDTEEIARRALRRQEAAWNAGDGARYGEAYEDAATFVNILGHLQDGAEAIAAGHEHIFATTHAGSVNRMELVGARRLADDVIVSTSRHTLRAPQGPLAGVHEALSTSVLLRDGDEWRFAATHNTLVGAR